MLATDGHIYAGGRTNNSVTIWLPANGIHRHVAPSRTNPTPALVPGIRAATS